MKKLISIAVVMLILGTMGSMWTMSSEAQEEDRTFNFFQGLGEQLADEVVYEQIEAVARPACQLYGLGVDVVNFFEPWNIQQSLVDITVLFRNEDWRELIWAIDDRRDQIRDRLLRLRQQECLLNFALPELRSRGLDASVRRVELQKGQLDRAIDQAETSRDYFAMKKKQMTFQKPRFFRYDTETVPDSATPLKAVPTDKIYYWLYEAPVSIDWQQVDRDAKDFFLGRLGPAFQTFFEQIPEGCFAFANVLDDQLELFLYAINEDFRQNDYKNFEEFLKERAQEISADSQEGENPYLGVCGNRGAVSSPEVAEGNTSVEEQYERFSERMTSQMKYYADVLVEYEQEILRLEGKGLQGEELTDDEKEQLMKLAEDRSWIKARIEYISLVLGKLKRPGETSLAKIGKSLASLVEAVLAVRRDRNGKVSSKLSIAERFQKRQERVLQGICTRLANMYRQSGRSTADLPIIGTANGKVYCRARPECANVNLLNLSGISRGDSKLAECSGFLFNSAELGANQRQRTLIQQDAEDLGELLEEQQLNDLLNKRNLHYSSLRGRITTQYKASSDGVKQLDQLIADISTDLYNPENTKPYREKRQQAQTHYGLLKRIYEDLFNFADEQPGYCPAEEEPGD